VISRDCSFGWFVPESRARGRRDDLEGSVIQRFSFGNAGKLTIKIRDDETSWFRASALYHAGIATAVIGGPNFFPRLQ
jgi:hypothetical protein